MLRSFISLVLMLLLLEGCTAVAQEHARGLSAPGTLGKPAKAKQIENKQSEIKGTQLSKFTITKVADISNIGTALINAGRSEGLNLGDTFTVVRRVNGRFVVVGEVKIIDFLQNSAVVQLISGNDVKQDEHQPLKVGDRFLKKE